MRRFGVSLLLRGSDRDELRLGYCSRRCSGGEEVARALARSLSASSSMERRRRRSARLCSYSASRHSQRRSAEQLPPKKGTWWTRKRPAATRPWLSAPATILFRQETEWLFHVKRVEARSRRSPPACWTVRRLRSRRRPARSLARPSAPPCRPPRERPWRCKSDRCRS
jgi:hypothetical protein